MPDPNTCEQCGVTNSNRTNVVIRQSGKGKLVCQACYDIINPPIEEEKEVAVHAMKIGDKYVEPTTKKDDRPVGIGAVRKR